MYPTNRPQVLTWPNGMSVTNAFKILVFRQNVYCSCMITTLLNNMHHTTEQRHVERMWTIPLVYKMNTHIFCACIETASAHRMNQSHLRFELPCWYHRYLFGYDGYWRQLFILCIFQNDDTGYEIPSKNRPKLGKFNIAHYVYRD